MNELLLSEINSDEKNLLQMLSLVEEFIFQSSSSINTLNSLIEDCQSILDEVEEPLQKAEVLINEIYIHHLFLDNQRAIWPVLAFQLQSGIEYRMISPILKAAIVQYIISACGFECDFVFVPEKVMVRVLCDESFAIIFDPISGESLDWQELDVRMDELEGDPSENHLKAMDHITLVTDYIAALKNALINEQAFDKALKCVDVLLSLRPDDPFERRDRGFLLHQLDCFKVAYDDYRFFVEQCPKDPAAQLLKLQLDQINISDTILH